MFYNYNIKLKKMSASDLFCEYRAIDKFYKHFSDGNAIEEVIEECERILLVEMGKRFYDQNNRKY